MRKSLLLAGASVLTLAFAASAQADSSSSASVNDTGAAVVQDNNAVDAGNVRNNFVTGGTLDGASGIYTMQQNNGSSASVKSATAVLVDILNTDDVDTEAASYTNVDDNTFDSSSDERTNLLTNSFTGFSGIATVQQNNGDVSDLASSTSVYAGLEIDGDVDQTANADARARDNNDDLNTNATKGSDRDNDIIGAFSGDAQGIASVQQNNGDANGMSQATAVAADLDTGPNSEAVDNIDQDVDAYALSEDNTLMDSGSIRNNEIGEGFNGSFDSFEGIASVQQNNGDGNAMAQSTAVAANLDAPDDPQFNDGAQQNVDVYSKTFDNRTFDNGGDRDNLIAGSFDAIKGIFSVQQNNGNANAMGQATAVMVNLGSNEAGDEIQQRVYVTGYAGGDDAGSRGKPDDLNSNRDNLISGSFQETAQGIVSVQQNNGDRNAMGIGNAVAVTTDALGVGGVGGNVQNDVDQLVSVYGEIKYGDTISDADDSSTTGARTNSILASFDSAQGIVSVQQNNGTQNVMGIGNAIVINDAGSGGSFNGSDDVQQVSMVVGGDIDGTTVDTSFANTPPPFHRTNTIAQDSFDGYQGIATVQQNNGDNNIIGAANAVAATINGGDEFDSVDQEAATKGTVTNVDSLVSTPNGASDRLNVLTGVFDGASALVTVQQNNGNNNVMSSANSVTANVNGGDNNINEADSLAKGEAKVSGNFAEVENNADRVNRIENTANSSAQGIFTIQQNNGDNNVMGASTAVAVNVGGGAADGWGPATATATLAGTTSGNTTVVSPTAGAPGLVNTVSNSFNGAKGVGTIQQNNGSNSVVMSAISVVANVN